MPLVIACRQAVSVKSFRPPKTFCKINVAICYVQVFTGGETCRTVKTISLAPGFPAAPLLRPLVCMSTGARVFFLGIYSTMRSPLTRTATALAIEARPWIAVPAARFAPSITSRWEFPFKTSSHMSAQTGLGVRPGGQAQTDTAALAAPVLQTWQCVTASIRGELTSITFVHPVPKRTWFEVFTF